VPDKAYLETEKGEKIPCLFNPSALQVTRVNQWSADVPAAVGTPRLRFAGARSGTMHLELFFDTTDTGKAVTEHTAKLLALMEAEPSLAGADANTGNTRPQWVKFHWGDLHSFKAVISSLDLTFIYFAGDGTPLRARADVVLTQFEQELAFSPQNPTSGTPRPHRVHRVSPGETLDRIAAVHYGDPTKWRDIAAANQLEDPLAVKPGTVLAIPSLDGA
jgi:hypothetical protein